MLLVIRGAPVTKKNHSRIITNRATGKPLLLPSAPAKRWTAIAVYQLAEQWRRAPLDAPVSVRATFYRARAVGDLVNFMQALADALEAAKVVTDDRLIHSWDGTRLDKDAENPRVELFIAPMVAQELPPKIQATSPGSQVDLLDPALLARWEATAKR